MRVRFLQSIAGVYWYYDAGEMAEVDDVTATNWINSGVAEYIAPPSRAKESTAIEPRRQRAQLPAAKAREV